MVCDKGGVRRSAIADVLKIWVWAIGSLLIALWLTPAAFNGGKALAELSATKDFNGALNKLAAWSAAAELVDFFKICWPLVAVLLFFPLVEWLGIGSGIGGKKGAWRRWPARRGSGAGDSSGQPITRNQFGPLQLFTGFLLSLGCFLLIGYVMIRAGAFSWELEERSWTAGLWWQIGWALGGAFVIEMFFRCMVLGVFLRAMGVIASIMLTAVMFAGVGLVISGFSNAGAADAETITTFRLLGLLFGGGNFGMRLLLNFLPWFAFGCVLGWARWRTASLWLPVGLLAGWLQVGRLFAEAANPAKIPDSLLLFISTDSVHNGIMPFFGAIFVGWIVHVFTHLPADQNEADH